MRLTRGRTVAFSLVVLALAIIWRVASPRALDVDIAVVSRGPLEITIDEEARTEIRHHAEVAAPVSGRVSNSTVVAGDVVTRGDIVARLAPAPLDPRARAEAEAALRESTSLLHEASARVAQARLALDDARKDRARTERLSATGAVAPRDLEAAVTAVRQREREVDAATARQAAATQEEQRARAALMPTDPAKTRAGTMTLRSPISGRVLRVFEEHDRVVAAGTPLVEVGDPSSIEVVIPVLTRDALSVTPRLPVRLRLGEGRTVRGEVVRVEPAAYTKLSPLGVEEQRVNVRARFLEAVSGVGDGYEVHASIVTWQTDRALSVPVTGLVPHDTGWAVYVVSRGRARLNPVAVGRRGGMAAEVLTGVAAGDTVVSYPDERLSVGTRVRPAEPRR